MYSEAVEDYLRAVFELEGLGQDATTSELSIRLGVTQASVSGMVRRLAGDGLVEHERYRGVRLTEQGRRVAVELTRHHRLIELYLARQLDVPWDRVHAEAERWEHVLSDDLEKRIDAALGHPRFDPHGAPIPQADGSMEVPERIPIVRLGAGDRARIAEVSDHDPELLRYVGQLGLYPGTAVEVVEVALFNGPLTLKLDGESRVLGREAALHILVDEVVPAGDVDSPQSPEALV